MRRTAAISPALLATAALAATVPAAEAAGRFSAPVVVDDLAVSGGPLLTTTGDGGLALAWSRAGAGRQQALLAARAPTSNTFGPPVLASDVTRDLRLLELAPRAGFGEATLLAQGYEPSKTTFTTATVGGEVTAVAGYEDRIPVGGSVAVAPDGTTTVAWRTMQAITFCCAKIRVVTRPPGGAWSAPRDLQLGDAVGQLAPPVLSVDGSGATTLAWGEELPGARARGVLQDVVVRHRPAGGDWGPPQVLQSRSYGAVVALKLVTRPNGRAVIAWWAGSAAPVMVAEGAGGTFGTPVVAATTAGLGSDLDLATNDRGDVALAVRGAVAPGRFPRAAVALRSPAGAWQPPEPVGGCGVDVRSLALGPDGEVALAWQQDPGVHGQSGGSPAPSSVLAALRAADGTWSPAERVGTADSATDSQLVHDGRRFHLAQREIAAGVARIALSSTVDDPAPTDPAAPPATADDPTCVVPPTPPPPPLPGPPAQVAPRPHIVATVARGQIRTVRLRITCPRRGRRCIGLAGVVTTGGHALASTRLDLASRATRTLTLRLRSPVRDRRRLRAVTLTVTADGRGTATRARVLAARPNRPAS